MSFQKIGNDGRPFGAIELAAFLDEKTGLLWAAKDVSENRMTHAEAMKSHVGFRCAGLGGWDVPTIDELETLRDRDLFNPTADPALGLKPEAYWSSTTSKDPSLSYYAWIVSFYYGASGLNYKNYEAFVRLVRRAGASQ